MKVILLSEIKGKGGEGDVIDVARGYANNYLLPQGFAVKATEGNLKQLEQRRNNIAKREEVRVSKANELAEKIDGTTVRIPVQIGEGGQLFGSITNMMIADAVNEKFDTDIDRHRVELNKPIKTVGEYPITIVLYRDIKAVVNVVVVDRDVPVDNDGQAASPVQADDAAGSGAEGVAEASETEAADELSAEEEPAVEDASEAEEAADAAEPAFESGADEADIPEEAATEVTSEEEVVVEPAPEAADESADESEADAPEAAADVGFVAEEVEVEPEPADEPAPEPVAEETEIDVESEPVEIDIESEPEPADEPAPEPAPEAEPASLDVEPDDTEVAE